MKKKPLASEDVFFDQTNIEVPTNSKLLLRLDTHSIKQEQTKR